MELLTTVFLTVNAEMMPAPVVVTIQAANTANWVILIGFGLPPSYLIIQTTDGSSVSAMGMCTAAM